MIRRVHDDTVMKVDFNNFSYEHKLELLQASRLCQLQLEMLSCSRLMDVKKDLLRISDMLTPWL